MRPGILPEYGFKHKGNHYATFPWFGTKIEQKHAKRDQKLDVKRHVFTISTSKQRQVKTFCTCTMTSREICHVSGSLQNRRISGVRTVHERTSEARGQKNPPVITPLFMLFRPQTHPKWPANHSVRKTMVITACCTVGQILHIKLGRSCSHHLWRNYFFGT